MNLLPGLHELLIQSVITAIWKRPEVAPLREPIEAALKADAFSDLLKAAFNDFAERSQAELPKFFDAGFLRTTGVAEHLSAYVVQGQAVDLDKLAELYAKRHLDPTQASDVRVHLENYLRQLRRTCLQHPTYGALILANDVQEVFAALMYIRDDLRDGFAQVLAGHATLERTIEAHITRLLDELRQDPTIKRALDSAQSGGHIFLSYTRSDTIFAVRLKNDLEQRGHTVWIDTSSIRGGDDWIAAIEDGINRCYALITVVSTEANQSKWVRREFLFADNKDKRIIPVLAEDCDLRAHMVDLNALPGYTDHYDTLVEQLLAVLPAADAPEKVVLPAVLLNARTYELKYLDRVWLENELWLETYTPMAGYKESELK